MLTTSEKKTLRGKLDDYEGTIEHMYLDSKGYVTVGIGHLISTVAAAQKVPFIVAKTSKKATAGEIKTDHESVKKQTKNRVASYYKKYTKLKLTQSEIDKLTNKHIEIFHKELKQIYSDFNSYPSNVKLALFDLIFNLGMPSLKNKWPTFNKHIKAKEWQKAADNSSRKVPISAARNKYVKDLLEKTAKATDAAKVPKATNTPKTAAAVK